MQAPDDTVGYLIWDRAKPGVIEYRELLSCESVWTGPNREISLGSPKSQGQISVHDVKRTEDSFFIDAACYFHEVPSKTTTFQIIARLTGLPVVKIGTAGESGELCEFTIFDGEQVIKKTSTEHYAPECPKMATFPAEVKAAMDRLEKQKSDFPAKVAELAAKRIPDPRAKPEPAAPVPAAEDVGVAVTH